MSIHAGHRKRVKDEFIARGTEGWPDHRILELLLFYSIPQGDVNALAHTLIDRFGTLAGVLDASFDELKKTTGVGEHTAVLLTLIPEIGARYQAQRAEAGKIISCAEQAASVLAPYFYGALNEMVYILCMDGKNKLLGVRKVAEGSIYAADISIRRIAEEAIGLRAAGIYLAHNHITNLAFPSPEDWHATDTIRASLAGIGLDVVDHLIFVDGDAVSLRHSQHAGTKPVYQLI